MVLTFEESKELEMLKHKNRLELNQLSLDSDTRKHKQRMIELEKEFEIAKEGKHETK